MTAGLILAALSAVCFGLLPIFGKLGFAAGMDVPLVLACRFSFGTAAFGLWLALTKPASLRPGRKTLVKAAFLGVCIYPLQSFCFMAALERVSASLPTLILYFYPVMVTILSMLFLGRRFSRQMALALVVTLAGCCLVFSDAFLRGADLTGVLFALGAMSIFSCYLVLVERLLRGENPQQVTFFVLLGAAIVFTSWAGPDRLLGLTGQQFGVACGLGVVSCALSVGLLYLAIELVGSAYASVFSTVEPVATVAAAWLILGEAASPAQLAGAALIIAGILWPNRHLLRGAPKRAAPGAPLD